MKTQTLYGGASLNRAHHLRHGADLAALAARPDAKVTLYWRGRQLVAGDAPACAFLGGRAAVELGGQGATMILLGMEGDAPILAMDVSALDGGEDGPEIGLGRWAALRSIGGQLTRDEAGLMAYARGMMVWREKTRFCPVCGGALVFVEGGHSAKCSDQACGALQFPRTDPAIIMLVTDPQGRALLGRQAVWAPGMHSCLAGFVEPGESLEDAVAREVWEEAGITVISARYGASQPWPFPCSLMIGFFAEAEAGEPNPDKTEIEDARWFTRAEVAQFGEYGAPGLNGMFLPSRDSIARALVNHWLKG